LTVAVVVAGLVAGFQGHVGPRGPHPMYLNEMTGGRSSAPDE
jgi:hypothetical protein